MTNQRDYLLTDMPEGPDYPWCDLFQTRRYFRLHPGESNRYLVLRRQSDDEAIAAIHFSEIEPGHFRSPGRATFGGPAFAVSSGEVTETFLRMVCEKLRTEGVAEVSRSVRRRRMSRHEPRLFGRHSKPSDLRCGRPSPTTPYRSMPPTSQTKMAQGRRQLLRKCERDGFRFVCATESSQRRSIYDTILTNCQGSRVQFVNVLVGDRNHDSHVSGKRGILCSISRRANSRRRDLSAPEYADFVHPYF